MQRAANLQQLTPQRSCPSTAPRVTHKVRVSLKQATQSCVSNVIQQLPANKEQQQNIELSLHEWRQSLRESSLSKTEQQALEITMRQWITCHTTTEKHTVHTSYLNHLDAFSRFVTTLTPHSLCIYVLYYLVLHPPQTEKVLSSTQYQHIRSRIQAVYHARYNEPTYASIINNILCKDKQPTPQYWLVWVLTHGSIGFLGYLAGYTTSCVLI